MHNKITALALCVVIFLMMLLTSCSNEEQVYENQAFKMDTTMDLKAYGPNARTAVDAAYKRIDEIEQMASASVTSSDVYNINQAAGKSYVKVHPEVMKMIRTCIEYSKISEGAFDITVGPLIKLWGIGTPDEKLPSDTEIKQLLPLVGYTNISLNEADSSVKLMKEGMSIELGGIAKGFTADEVIKVFKSYRVQRAIINLGGSSVYTLGQKQDGTKWSVGIQHPRKAMNQGNSFTVRMHEDALSTSGDYERYFIKDGVRYHHILSPFTGYPAESGVMSDTIIVDSSIPDCNMLADILTKVTFVLGVKEGLKVIDSLKGVSCIVQTTDYKLYKSTGWKYSIEDVSPDFTMVN